jgi:release factor glutamine methyltransferase
MSGSEASGPAGSAPEWVVAALRAAGCVFAEEEAAILVAAAGGDELAEFVRRRAAGMPLEHLVGWVEFAGLRVAVDEGVFVPRRRSELLVRAAVEHLRRGRSGGSGPVVVDLCCGCGAIGLAIAHSGPGVRLHAADIDPNAVRCAARNLAAVGGTAYRGDLFAPLPQVLHGRVDVLVGNAPYVPSAAIALMPPEARDHESAVALDGGADGTDILRRIIGEAPAWLAVGGVLLVEIGRSQVERITTAVRDAGLVPQVVADDDLGGLIAVGRRPVG